jgi:hypothetical protein
MRLHLVTKADNLLPHPFHHIDCQHASIWLLVAGFQQLLRHLSLLLANREPAHIEVVPKFDPVRMQFLLIAEDT